MITNFVLNLIHWRVYWVTSFHSEEVIIFIFSFTYQHQNTTNWNCVAVRHEQMNMYAYQLCHYFFYFVYHILDERLLLSTVPETKIILFYNSRSHILHFSSLFIFPHFLYLIPSSQVLLEYICLFCI